MPLPRIAVTMGDPAGIGPELCLQLLANKTLRNECLPVIFGDAAILARAASACHLPGPVHVITAEQWEANFRTSPEAVVLDLKVMAADDLQPGRVDKETGGAAYRYLDAAVEAALSGKVDAITTCPINKEALRAAGLNFPGHTEILAAKTRTDRFCMMLTSPELTCSFVTVHVGYHEVPDMLTVERIGEVIDLTAEAMQQMRGRPPKLVVCGLNPHAGEHGLFGKGEEERVIMPAIEAARTKGHIVEGPLPPDTAFLTRRRLETDAFICMYHDQGHIPLKALAFEDAINVTLGLPIIRTSVDHGTALDIAWQGKADPNSLFEATRLAGRLARKKS